MGAEWIDDLSHELRAPLANLSARLEAMEEGLWPADSDHLRACRDDVTRLVHLVERIEAVAQAECAGPSPGTPVQLDHLVTQACLSSETLFLSRGVSLSWDCPPLCFLGDEGSLRTVVLELLSNAAQATPRGGRVEVHAKPLTIEGQPRIEILVRDTGRGISKDCLPHLFEKFFRADPSRSSLTGGPGLGLAMCRSLVHQHGGAISAESQLGRGSEFRIDLPQFDPKECVS